LAATLGLASVEGLVVALLGLVLFHSHRNIGVIPFVAFFSLVAGAVPLTVTEASLDLAFLGTVPHAKAALVPVLVSFVVLVHLTRGWRNAQLAALMILGAGLFVGLGVIVDAYAPVLLGASVLPAEATTPIMAAAIAWAAASLASVTLAGIAEFTRKVPALTGLFLVTFLGIGLGGLVGLGFLRAGYPIGNAQGWGPLAGPGLAGIPSVIVVIGYGANRLSGMWEETRRALLSREPLGSESQVEAAHALQESQQQAAEATRREADAYRQLIETDDRGAYVCNTKGRITYANQGLARVLDRPDEDLSGENIRHLFGETDEHGRPQFVDYPVKPGRHRARVRLPNGHQRSIEVTVRPTQDGNLYGRVRDRTEDVLRRELEEQKELAEFYVDLLRHDIGNDVTTPLNYLAMLEHSDNLSEKEERYLKASRAAVENIADLLDRVNVLTGLQDVDPEPTDAGRILHDVGQQFREKYPDEASLSWDMPDEPVVVAGLPLLETAFVNLVGNAMRHAGSDADIVLGAHKRGDEWELRVDDNGPGIPDEVKEEIFERGDRDEAQGGQGLGLYIVKTIVNALDGEVWVEDRVEGRTEAGASFRVRLPATSQQAEQLGSQSSVPVQDD
jgi:signal transduction histidine kinase